MLTAIGMMSGTSLDGVDAAIVMTDGERVELTEHFISLPYNDEMRELLRKTLGDSHGENTKAEESLTYAHAEAVKTLLAKAGMKATDIDVIGFHGQTTYHRPEDGVTIQMGNGELLAQLTGITVVNDFRTADVKAGGQGAPLVPLFHDAVTKGRERPIAILNIGGVANITYLGVADEKDESLILGFDTGPGNAMIDDWVFKKTGKRFDEDGKLAQGGQVHESVLKELLSDAFFDKIPPKSLDRDNFVKRFDETVGLGDEKMDISIEDGTATLAAFTVESIKRSCEFFETPPREWFVTGGGRLNRFVMKQLKVALDGEVYPIEELGLNGDAIEAQAFAFLAVRSLKKLPLTLPSTTGANHAVIGGVVCPALRADAV
jgi:anhydro-N-acetylmuramic acid kinase